jgi:hypothetical protein
VIHRENHVGDGHAVGHERSSGSSFQSARWVDLSAGRPDTGAMRWLLSMNQFAAQVSK